MASLLQQPLHVLRHRAGTGQVHAAQHAHDGMARRVEADAHGLHQDMLGHSAQQRVGNQHAPHFLHHQLGLAAAQHAVAVLQ